MNTTTCLLAAIAGLAAPAVAGRAAAADVEAEKAAITAVIEEEKDAYLAFDDARLAATWIQQPSSMKLYVFDGRETRIDGWAAIRQHDRDNLVRERASVSRPSFEFSDYRITLQGDSAWVILRAKVQGVAGGIPFAVTQSRICVLRQEDGRWKIALMAISQLASENPGAGLPARCDQHRYPKHVPPSK